MKKYKILKSTSNSKKSYLIVGEASSVNQALIVYGRILGKEGAGIILVEEINPLDIKVCNL